MSEKRRELPWWALGFIVLALVASLRWSGHLVPLEHFLADARSSWLAREVSTDTVIVGIDPRSLAALNHWPWPRVHHAQLLHVLEEAEPASVFFDVDFSATTTAEDDALFEQALSRWSNPSVVLPVHFQPASGADDALVLAEPLERFSRHTEQASIMLVPDPDGLVRGMHSSWEWNGRRFRSLAARLGGVPDDTWITLDFSILPSSFGYVSYVDLLSGAVPASELAGKNVYIGATALELRDIVPVPIHRSLPGVVVLALAAESARTGLITRLPEWLYLLVLAGCIAAAAKACHRRGWRRNGALLVAVLMSSYGAALLLMVWYRVELELAPLAVGAAGVFVASALHALDRQSWLALANALGIKRREALLRSVVEASTDAIICVDHEGVIRTANPAAARLFCRAPEQLIGCALEELVPGLAPAATPAGGAVEHEALREGREPVPVEVTMSRVALREQQLYTAIVRDISRRKAHQRQLEYQATHDQMTGLANRRALIDCLEAALDANRNREARVVLLALGLSRFKEVNDTLGHDAGDLVLCEIARRLRDAAGGAAFIARTGGDEFSVVMRDAAEADVERMVAGLTRALRRAVEVAGIRIELGAGIGAAMSDQHASDARSLIKRAGIAMHAAKRVKHTFAYYRPEEDRHTVRGLRIMGELRRAITNSQLALHYQPQVSLRTGRAESVEALLRWSHPVLGEVHPAEFVELAESTQLIQPLTDWTLNEALRQWQVWDRDRLPLRIAVNVSARLLQDVDFPRRVRAMLSRHAVPADCLELEITESAMMLDLERARRTLEQLHAAGIVLAVDDFGTGFSSLRYLRDLPVHTVKLDKSFVIDLEQRQDNRAIVDSTIKMAHALNLDVVAEGVETDWVRRHLARAGYDLGQGFLFAAAMPPAQCLRWFAARDAEGRAVNEGSAA